MKRREVKLKNNPGISKIFGFSEEKQKWIDTGKYRAMKRINQDGISKKASAFFDNIEDAKAFRTGEIEKHDLPGHHKVHFRKGSTGGLKFGELVEQWRAFHFLTVEASSQDAYDSYLKLVDRSLSATAVEEISAEVIDEMIRSWKERHLELVAIGEGKSTRQSFKKELDTLKLVLNFYRTRTNPRYMVPIFRDHYRASRVVVKVDDGVRSIRADDLPKFFSALKRQKKAPLNFSMALTQFCLSLRACELCGLKWEDFDFEHREVTIRRSIVWDRYTWEPSVKERPKNGRSRVLVVPEVLISELEKLEPIKDRRVGFLFVRNGKPYSRKTLACAYERALKIARIDYVKGTHVLRKTSATQANALTGDFFAVSESLGHSDVSETRRYVESVNANKQKVASALNEAAQRALRGT